MKNENENENSEKNHSQMTIVSICFSLLCLQFLKPNKQQKPSLRKEKEGKKKTI